MPKKCKICGSPTHIIQDNTFEIRYYHCHNCEFIQMDDRERISFNEERELYDLHENSINDEGYVKMLKSFLDSAVMPFKQRGLALDFGSGPEPVLVQLVKRDYDFEVDHYDLHYKPEKIYIGKKYEVIVLTEVLEHLPDPMEAFKLFYDLLEDGGIVAFMTLFHHNDQEAFVNWWYRRDETHISFFTIKTLKYIAERIGYEIIYTDNKRVCTFKKS